MVSNPVWLKSIRRAADSNPRTSIRKASVMTTRPEGILSTFSVLPSGQKNKVDTVFFHLFKHHHSKPKARLMILQSWPSFDHKS